MKNLYISLIFFLTLSCQSPGNISQEERISVACIGDSITYGIGIKKRINNSYPYRLSKYLGEEFQVVNFGVNGSTLLRNGNKPYVNTTAYKKALKYNPDIVIIKLGTNDSKIKNWKYKENFTTDYKEFIESFNKLTTNPEIYICLPVPAFSYNFGIRNEIIYDEIIPRIREVALNCKVELINLYDPLLEYEKYFPDSIHPDKYGAEVIAAHVYESIIKNN